MIKRKNSHDGALPTAYGRAGARGGAGSWITMRSAVLLAALFCSVFTVASVSRLTRGGAIPDTRSPGAEAEADAASAAAEADAAAIAEAEAAVPEPLETPGSLADHHQHTPHAHVASGGLDASAPPKGLFALTATDLHGRSVPLSKYAGKVLLVVNTASACGYTATNMESLASVRAKYAPFGFEVLAFPSDSFRQEPLDGPEIERWARDTYKADFPFFAKGPVVGEGAQPVFQFLARGVGRVKGREDGPAWNFWKAIVHPSTGEVLRTYSSAMRQRQLEHDIYGLLTEGKLPPAPAPVPFGNPARPRVPAAQAR